MPLLRLVLIGCLILLPACGGGDSGTGPTQQIPIAGGWTGSVSSGTGITATLTLSLSESGGTVSGSGTLATSSGSLSLTAHGTYSEPSASVTLSSQGFQPMTLTATVAANSMTGDLNGSGFDHRAITFARQ